MSSGNRANGLASRFDIEVKDQQVSGPETGLDGQLDVKEGNWIEVLALMNRYQPPLLPWSDVPRNCPTVRAVIQSEQWNRCSRLDKRGNSCPEERENQGVTENCPGHITGHLELYLYWAILWWKRWNKYILKVPGSVCDEGLHQSHQARAP